MALLPRKGWSKVLKSFYDWVENKDGNGTVPAVAGLTVENHGAGPYCKTVLKFDNVAFALTDEAGVVAYTGKKIYDLPEGMIAFVGAQANLALSKSSAGVNADWDGDFALGTVTASNNNSLSSTEQNLIPTTATPQAAAGVTTAKGVSTSNEALKIFDGTGTPVDVYLNFLIDDADHDVAATPCNLIVNGDVTLLWANIGDK